LALGSFSDIKHIFAIRLITPNRPPKERSLVRLSGYGLQRLALLAKSSLTETSLSLTTPTALANNSIEGFNVIAITAKALIRPLPPPHELKVDFFKSPFAT
jgi:hypothetical protein